MLRRASVVPLRGFGKWRAILLAFVGPALATPALAQDCLAERKVLEQAVTAALRMGSSALCPALRRIPQPTEQCTAETAAVHAQIRGLISVRCPCPEDATRILSQCKGVAETSACDDNQASAILQCVYDVRRIARCPKIGAEARRSVLQALEVVYGGCLVCQNYEQEAANLASLAQRTSECQQLTPLRQRRHALLTCPQVKDTHLGGVDDAIRTAGIRIPKCSPCSDLACRLRSEIERLNRRLQETSDCARDPVCEDLERQRLALLGTYLEYVQTRKPAELTRARLLLRGVGLDPSAVETIKRIGPDEVRMAANIASLFASSELRSRFLSELQAAHLKELAELARQDQMTFGEFLNHLLKQRAAVQERVFNLAEGLQGSAQRFQVRMLAQEHRGRWEIWIDPTQDQCDQCGAFIDRVLEYFPGALVVQRTAEQFLNRVAERNAACRREHREKGQSREDPQALSCGPLLNIQLAVRESEMQAFGDVYLVLGEEQANPAHGRGRSEVPVKHGRVELPAFARFGDQGGAAREFARRTLIQTSALLPAAPAEPPPSRGPSEHCGVSVTFGGEFEPAPVGKNLRVEGDCAWPEFQDGLSQALATNSLIGSVDFGRSPASAEWPTLRFSLGDREAGVDQCVGRLLNAREEEQYVVKAVVDSLQRCSENLPTRWQNAGADVGRLLLGYYALPRVTSVSGSSTPTVTSSGWYAAGFAGTPYLMDSRARTWTKVTPTILDGALLAAAGLSFGMSVKLRNDYAAGRIDSMDQPELALNIGGALLIGVAVTRLVSGLVYENAPAVWRKAQ